MKDVQVLWAVFAASCTGYFECVQGNTEYLRTIISYNIKIF